VMPMPPVPTHLVASYVLATQASVVMESAVQNIVDPIMRTTPETWLMTMHKPTLKQNVKTNVQGFLAASFGI